MVLVDDLAVLGPFFTLHTHLPSTPVTEPWQAMHELVTDPDVLQGRVAGVRAHLAAAGAQPVDAVPLRVAASVTQMGLVARLISPALALALATGQVPDLDLTQLRWQPVLGGAFPLSLPAAADTNPATSTAGDPPGWEQVATALAGRVLDGPVRQIVDATRPFSVSTRILWGNTASAVHGAAAMITAARPAWTAPTRTLTALLLSRPPLHDTSTRTADGTFRRRSCCLIYQAAPGSAGPLCGDCILSARKGH